MNLKTFLEINGVKWPKEIHKVPGKECVCAAHGECECCCGEDWTDYEPRNKSIKEFLSLELPENLVVKEE